MKDSSAQIVLAPNSFFTNEPLLSAFQPYPLEYELNETLKFGSSNIFNTWNNQNCSIRTLYEESTNILIKFIWGSKELEERVKKISRVILADTSEYLI